MIGNFMYENPTRLYFGEDSLNNLEDELKKYGSNVLFIYGTGSIKKNGIYDSVTAILKKCNKNIFFDPGVMPNPTKDKLYEGVKIAKENNIDFILAVGGGSVVDYAKAVSVSVKYDGDPWDKYFLKMEDVSNPIIPVGVVLTMVGTGSEMNGGSVITDPGTGLKIGHVFGANVFPKFSILNPKFTYTVPKYQMIAGIYDTMNHIMEQYFSGNDNSTSDYIMEGLMREIIDDSRIAVKDTENYEARSNIMWTATWALNTLVSMGKPGDWMIHMIGQSIGGVTNATHGMTLSAITYPYYSYILPYGVKQFKKFAINVFNVPAEGLSDEEVAKEGLKRLRDWMEEIGLVLNLKELGVTSLMFDKIIEGTFISDSGYKKLSKDEIKEILNDSM